MIVQEWNRLSDDGFHKDKNEDFFAIDSKELLLRSSMLAICHVATNPWGLDFIIDTEMPLIISQLTQFHPSLNVRG